ncbi:hypothetical protein AMELA_G00217020 [Ameiurus melas]|uniref:Uncharacterized protein n=1 Tax=Ameiurus melas TaxID=219545 RepID=A0A7J6A144_AMEME|nr:hypothetical protein AMELA_G00217020 [Ameiurus melas]
MAGGKKRTARPSAFQTTVNSIWQDKHLILFKPEYTLLVAAVLWCVEVGINVLVIQKVAWSRGNLEPFPGSIGHKAGYTLDRVMALIRQLI